MTPQQKILHVANSLGITDLKNMQASTGTLYHEQNISTGPGANQPNYQFFGGALQGATWIQNTNVSPDSKLEVCEAFLVEKIQFNRSEYVTSTDQGRGTQTAVQDNIGAIIDFYIGNKRVVKELRTEPVQAFLDGVAMQYYDSCEIYLEGAGILIPPQVEFYVNANFFYYDQNRKIANEANYGSMCTLYGTRVLLNLNTSL